MKIEVAPWIRDYVTNMEELYCELVLEKLNNRPSGKEPETLARYQLMFKGRSVSSKKILIKGDPGIGKTTLVKKIAWDWAKGQFSKISIVFFLYLKSVKPDEAIENAIIEQMPELEGLHIAPRKLESFIENFGDRCLLILDGLDEHALGQNKDVVKVIQHRKYLKCNILLTSKPHSTREVERHFDTIVRVKGFARNEARKFASYIVPDDNNVGQILDFNPAGTKRDIVLSECPILLSFMCILVRETELDLTRKTMSHGEIYTRMMQCLYKKFCNRTNIKFEHENFFKVITSLGKLALEALVTGYSLFQRSRVVEEVDEEVFDYGLLIGNEDMIRHLVADILITFPHRSIQELLGAFYFVLMLGAGASVDSLLRQKDRELVLLDNPLFLHFCFWLLSEKCQEECFPCFKKAKACATLYLYIFELIHGKQLNFRNISEAYPAIDLYDEVCLEHLGQILEMCNDVMYVTLSDGQPIRWILNHLPNSYNTLKVIVVEDENLESQNAMLPHLTRCKDSDSQMNLVLFTKVSEAHVLLESCLDSRIFSLKKPAVHFTCTDDISLDNLLRSDLRKLSINAADLRSSLYITCSNVNSVDLNGSLECYCFLTHLSIVDHTGFHVMIDTAVLSALSCAVREGRLPSLTNLQFANVLGLNKRLKHLFDDRSTWPTLTHLCFYDCKLSMEDMQTLGAASQNSFPKVTFPSLSGESGIFGTDVHMLFPHEWANLTRLSLQELTRDGYMALMSVISKGLLTTLVQLRLKMDSKEDHLIAELKPEQIPRIKYLGLQRCVGSAYDLKRLAEMSTKWKLRTLDISHSSGITRKLSHLLSHNFRFLKTLILSWCMLDTEDLSSLSHAQVEGRLEKLIHLDISKNLLSHIGKLFDHSCKLEGLRRLNIAGIGDYFVTPTVHDLAPFMLRGCLLSLCELRWTDIDCIFTVRSLLQSNICLKQIQRLEIDSLVNRDGMVYLFDWLAYAVRKELFPKLETVCVVCTTRQRMEKQETLRIVYNFFDEPA